ncbi:hypothetical protein TSAR_015458 [Trichomalopsis sarcophagae]|uniref:Uncharacterized protein n=1 Tax=Trichomalopsis sarcophagae TaxID=543379 RepID=A0A232EET2_9HYME|nr:hypothetical protein TSAR_015458 [Trichomalopsis sarcophagae]
MQQRIRNREPYLEPTETVSHSGFTTQNNSTWVQKVAENKSENITTKTCKQHNTANIRLARAGRSPRLISLQSEYIIRNKADFYIDTGAEISVVKRRYVNEKISLIASPLTLRLYQLDHAKLYLQELLTQK